MASILDRITRGIKAFRGDTESVKQLTQPNRNLPGFQVFSGKDLINASKAYSPFSQMALDFINSATNLGTPYTEQQLLAAYMSSVYMFAALTRVSNLISRVKIVAEIKEGENYIRTPETALINRIFEQEGSELLSRMYLNYAIFGAAAVYKVKTRKAILEESRETPIYDYKDGAVGGLHVIDKPQWDLDEDWTYGGINGLHVSQNIPALGDRTYLDRKEFVYITGWNPDQPNRGKSIVAVAIHEAVSNSSIAQWMSDYFTRGAMPLVMVALSETDPAMLTQSDLAKYKREFEDRWQGGVGSSLRSVFLDRKVEVNQVGIPASDIGAPELNQTALEGISAAVGIDRELIVTPEGGSQERHAILVKRAWDDTVIPVAEKFLTAFNRDLGLPTNMRLILDLSGIDELEADREEKSATEINVFQAGIQTINETRNRLKMTPIEEFEGFWNFNGTVMPIDKIKQLAKIPHPELREYVTGLWESNLLKRSEALEFLGLPVNKRDRDGFKADLENGDEFLTGLWQDDLLTRSQILKMMDLSMPKGMQDGYRSELERGATFGDFVSGLWRDNLITRQQALQLLDMNLQLPQDAPNGYAEEISQWRENIVNLWRENLATRGQALSMLKVPAPPNALDGYNEEIQKKMNQPQDLREVVLNMWRENLLTRSEVLKLLGHTIPKDAIDGYVDEVNKLTEQKFSADSGGDSGQPSWRSLGDGNSSEDSDNPDDDPDNPNDPNSNPPAPSTPSGTAEIASIPVSRIQDKKPFWMATHTGQIEPNDGASISGVEEELLSEGFEKDPPLEGYYGSQVDVLPELDQKVDNLYKDQIDTIVETGKKKKETKKPKVEVIQESDEGAKTFEPVNAVDIHANDLHEMYVSLWFGANNEIKSIVDNLKQIIPTDSVINWQDSNTYHTTLVYSDQVELDQIDKIRKVLPANSKNILINAGPIIEFVQPDKKVIVLKVDLSDELSYLHNKIYTAFRTYGVDVSAYSLPGSYQPHITLGYVKLDAPQINYDEFITLQPQTIYIGIEDYDQKYEIPFIQHIAEPNASYNEITSRSTPEILEDTRKLNEMFRNKWVNAVHHYLKNKIVSYDIPERITSAILEHAESRLEDLIGAITEGWYDEDAEVADDSPIEMYVKSKIKIDDDDEIDELKTWQKATLKNGINKGLRFETYVLDEDTSKAIKEELKDSENTKEAINAIFDKYKTIVQAKLDEINFNEEDLKAWAIRIMNTEDEEIKSLLT